MVGLIPLYGLCIKHVRLFYQRYSKKSMSCFSRRVKFYLKNNTIYVKVVVLKIKLSEFPGASISGPAQGFHPGPTGLDEISCCPRTLAELDTTTPTVFAMFVTLRMSDAQKVVQWSPITTTIMKLKKSKDYKTSILGSSYLPIWNL